VPVAAEVAMIMAQLQHLVPQGDQAAEAHKVRQEVQEIRQ